MQLGELVARAAAQDPNKTAILFKDQQMTYGELNAKVNKVANGLKQLGVKQGDRVALYIHNLPQFVEAFYGAQVVGATVIPMNVMYKAGEIQYIINDAGVKAIITLAPFYPNVQSIRDQAPSLEQAIVLAADQAPGATLWHQAFAGQSDQATPAAGNEDDVAVILYTSGTTGKPKGAMLTHRNLIGNVQQCDQIERLKVSADDIVWLGLPMFHSYALSVGMNSCVCHGATMDIMERFDPTASLEMFQKDTVSIVLAAPPMYIAWVNHPNVSSYDLSSIRVASSGAAALPVAVLEKFHHLTGVEIMEGYGLTETSPVATTNAAGPVTKPGSIGPAIPQMEIKIVDDNDNEVPVGEAGELVCRGLNVMKGYFNKPEANEEAFRNDWFHTGDIAKVDEDGYYYIVDRKKDMILVSGFNVYPREVEEVLYRHPKIADAAVVATPDEYQGESVLAFVVLHQGQEATEQEIIDYCRNTIANFKCPRRVEFRTELPKNMTGKVLRRELRDEAARMAAERKKG
ncbi:MAG TPA: long-chain fatty acid--CoA ligase [Ktedonobacterales bacterium]